MSETQTQTAEAGDVTTLRELEACSKEETAAFEQWAASKGYDMHEHPLHYLFMDSKTDAARQGWKAALRFAHDIADAALAASPAPRAPEVPEELRRLSEAASENWFTNDATPYILGPEIDGEMDRFAIIARGPHGHAKTGDAIRQWRADRMFAVACVKHVRKALCTLAAAPAAPPADGGKPKAKPYPSDEVLVVGDALRAACLREFKSNWCFDVAWDFAAEAIRALDAHRAALSSRAPAGAAGDPVGFDPQFEYGCKDLLREALATRAEGAGDSVAEPDPVMRPGQGPLDTQAAAGAAGDPVGENLAWLTGPVVRRAYEHFRLRAEYPFSPSAMREAITLALATRPASPAPAASAELTGFAEFTPISVQSGTAALAPAAQVNPGREEIARLQAQIEQMRRDAGKVAQTYLAIEMDRDRLVAILAARPGAVGDAGWVRTGWGSQGVSPGSGKDEWFRSSDGALRSYRCGFNPNTGRYESMTFTSAARPAPSPAKDPT